MIKVSGAVQKSTDIMKMVGQLVKVSDIRESMETLANEMTKAG